MIGEVEEGNVVRESSFHVGFVANTHVPVYVLSGFNKGGSKVLVMVPAVSELLVEERGVFLVIIRLCILLPVSFQLANHQASEHSRWVCGQIWYVCVDIHLFLIR